MQTALPHLVIIVDEFAELKAEQPDFMKELISAARIDEVLSTSDSCNTETKRCGRWADLVKFKI